MLPPTKVLLLRKSNTDNKRATEMCLTATHFSNFDACVAVCFLQAMEADNFPTWMCMGGNGGKYSPQQPLWLTLVLLTNQPSTQLKPRQGKKITVNNFLMLSQRNKEGVRKKRVRERGRERKSSKKRTEI